MIHVYRLTSHLWPVLSTYLVDGDEPPDWPSCQTNLAIVNNEMSLLFW